MRALQRIFFVGFALSVFVVSASVRGVVGDDASSRDLAPFPSDESREPIDPTPTNTVVITTGGNGEDPIPLTDVFDAVESAYARGDAVIQVNLNGIYHVGAHNNRTLMIRSGTHVTLGVSPDANTTAIECASEVALPAAPYPLPLPLLVPLFDVRDGASLVIAGLLFRQCSAGTLARVAAGARLDLLVTTIASMGCAFHRHVHAAADGVSETQRLPSFDVAGTVLFDNSQFTCENVTNPEASSQLAADAFASPSAETWLQSVVSPLFVSRGNGSVTLSSCYTSQWSLGLMLNTSRLTIQSSIVSKCFGGPCVLAIDNTTISASYGNFESPNVVRLQGHAHLSMLNVIIAARSWHRASSNEPLCIVLHAGDHSSLSLSGDMGVHLSGCDGFQLDGHASARASDVTAVVYEPVQFVWKTGGNAALALVGGSMSATAQALTTRVAMGVFGGFSSITFAGVALTYTVQKLVDNGFEDLPELPQIIIADDATAVLTNVTLSAEMGYIGGNFNGRHALKASGRASLWINGMTTQMCPGVVHALGHAVVVMVNSVIAGNNLVGGDSPFVDLWYADVEKGGLFYIEGSAVFEGTGLRVHRLMRAGMGGIGHVAGNASATISDTVVTVAGACQALGGGFYMTEGGTLSVRNSTFSSVFSLCDFHKYSYDGYGGFIFLNGRSRAVLEDLSLDLVLASYGGFIYAVENSHVTVDNVRVEAAYVNAKGGALYLGGNATVVLRNVFVTDAFAAIEGGFLYAGDTSMLDASDLELRSLESYRGSIYSARDSATVRIRNTTSAGHTCELSVLQGVIIGPAYYGARKMNLIREDPDNDALDGASPGNVGCGMYASHSSIVSLNSMSVRTVKTPFGGGGIALVGNASCELVNVTLAGIDAAVDAGAMRVANHASLTAKSLLIADLSARFYGACGMASGNALVSIDGLYANNTLSFGAGCFYLIDSASLTILHGTASHMGTSARGGFVTAGGSSTVRMSELSVRYTYAAGAGFALVTDTARLILHSVRVHAATSTTANGAAIVVESEGSCTVSNSVISKCDSAKIGGALFVSSSSPVTITNTTISECTATSGAALAAFGDSSVTLAHVTMHNCSVASAGGAVYAAENSAVNLTSVTSERTSTSGGSGGFLATAGTAHVNMTHCVVSRASSSAGVGGAIDATGRSVVVVDTSEFAGVSSHLAGGFLHQKGLSAVHLTSVTVFGATTESLSPGVAVRGGARLFMVDVTIFDALRLPGMGPGWISASDGAIGAYINVQCVNCTGELLKFDFYSMIFSDAFLPGTSIYFDEEGTKTPEFLMSIVTGSHRFLPLTTSQQWKGAVIDLETPFATFKVSYDGLLLRVRTAAALVIGSISAATEVSVLPTGTLLLYDIDLSTSPITVDGVLIMENSRVIDSPITVRNSGWASFDACTFAVRDGSGRSSIGGSGKAGSVPALVVLSDQTFTTVAGLIVGTHFATVGNGGFVSLSGESVLSIAGATVESVASSGSGGFVSVEQPTGGDFSTIRLSIRGVQIARCASGANGGFLSLRGNVVVTVSDCVIHASTADSQGGLVFAGETTQLDIKRTNISFSSSMLNGGVLNVIGSASVTLDTVFVTDASSAANGGFAALSPVAGSAGVPSLTANKITLSGAIASKNGGVFFSSGSEIHIRDSVLRDVAVGATGGLVHLAGDTPSHLSFVDSIFDTFHADIRAGLVSLTDTSVVSLLRCRAESISSKLDAGCIAVGGGVLSIAASEMVGCHAIGGGGGGVFVSGGAVDIVDSVFSNPKADLGGGLCMLQGIAVASFVNVTVVNSSTLNVGGGVFHVSGRSRLSADGLTVRTSSAYGIGGSIAMDGRATAEFDGLDVSDSAATFGQGGLASVIGSTVFKLNNSV
eukprot:Opistho-2@94319